ncbi:MULTISPECIES: bifunctional 4-hydroxy-3-methylbut-2-enyl diphosphate reductase/30S ribosomal protein S1 [unclassified Oscillibacter]|uniref:bifunctional 4-hydroxy-3-methylbut-2-enyl diphosphate reductase/30S ribosomal protein S1 n=1 Tax=unclassified Oscillibacter TaxID=2629304 RepID=UPI0025DC8387|nr:MULTISPECIES: bifunctional 4-hydroxy-3-methylbut-2-enyl diphosphate reductase/30S ribosomal protein S1 [unclassified Oscillibacter]
MKVFLAQSAGFCYGVERAVELTKKAAAKSDCCVMLGDLIHNAHVVAELEALGVRKIAGPEDAPEGATVVLRSHGERREMVEELTERGLRCVSAACPNVLRIQTLVGQAEEDGRQVIIIGERNHPEIQGIASYCRHPLIFGGPEELAAWFAEDPARRDLPITVAAQTTCIRELFETSIKILKKQCTNAKIFDTICNATRKRQSEAAEIAGRVDAMVVVGDPRSANTKHLTEICIERCPRVLQIEGADELSPDFFNGCSVAGLTAGASTPAGIIKEVYATMSEEIKNVESGEESFEELLNQSFKTLNTGEKVTGIVTAVGPTEVQVDVGAKQAAYIKASELSDDPNAKPEELLKVGDEIEAYIVRVNDIEGYAELSKKRLDTVKVWENIEQAVEDKTVMEGVVTEVNKGGVVVSVKGVRVFVPASQSGMPRGADLETMVKSKAQLRITEVNRARRRVVGSIRSVADEARRAAQDEVWNSIEVGKRYTGTVKSMTAYGVFVDIGGVDGMVHISELSWSRIKTPSEVCKVGDAMEVYVISFDAEKRKISLGVKDRGVNPWEDFMSKYRVGDVATVRIVKLMTFGAFAEVVPGVDGLIHISQIADRRIEKPGDVLSEGQEVDAEIIAVDEEKKKISLSIRSLLAPAEESADAE